MEVEPCVWFDTNCCEWRRSNPALGSARTASGVRVVEAEPSGFGSARSACVPWLFVIVVCVASSVRGFCLLRPFAVRLARRRGGWVKPVVAAVCAVVDVTFRPQFGRGNPLNLSISISGGEETNKDSLSNGE